MSFRGKRLGNSAGDFAVNDAITNYSIPYKTAGGKLLWLPPGVSTQSLKTVGSSIGWDTDETGSGGGGGGDNFFGPYGPKTTVPTSGWSWFNQRGSTVATSSRDGSVHLNVPLGNAGTSTVASARMRTAPSTPYTIIANIEGLLMSADFINYGLCFGNAGSEIRMLYLGYVSGNMNLYVAPTSGGTAGTAVFGPFSMNHNPPTFLAIRDDGTNKKYYIGHEEENMLELYSEARATGFTPTQVGFFGSPRQNTWPVRVTLWSWKSQSAAPA
jgi:hypothetical protein